MGSTLLAGMLDLLMDSSAVLIIGLALVSVSKKLDVSNIMAPESMVGVELDDIVSSIGCMANYSMYGCFGLCCATLQDLDTMRAADVLCIHTGMHTFLFC